MARTGTNPLTNGQQQFASRLAADTGLDAGVISAWLLAEESGSAAAARQQAHNHNWLNIGYTDSGTYGARDAVWSDPITAADATAAWLAGKPSVAGYGRASAGIQQVLTTAGKSPATQIAALQASGWASSGYPDLPALLRQVSGLTLPSAGASSTMPTGTPSAGTAPTSNSIGSDLLRGLVTAALAAAGALIAGLGIHAMMRPTSTSTPAGAPA